MFYEFLLKNMHIKTFSLYGQYRRGEKRVLGSQKNKHIILSHHSTGLLLNVIQNVTVEAFGRASSSHWILLVFFHNTHFSSI